MMARVTGLRLGLAPAVAMYAVAVAGMVAVGLAAGALAFAPGLVRAGWAIAAVTLRALTWPGLGYVNVMSAAVAYCEARSRAPAEGG